MGVGLGAASPTATASPEPAAAPVTFAPGRPLLFRRATVITMDPRRGILPDTDVLVRGTDITHQHMWQAAKRGVGADWTLAQYLDWMLMKRGPLFRPEDIHAANYPSMVEAVNDGVTTVMDWSHGLRTPDHADAAVDALFAVPGRARFGYSNAFATDLKWVYEGRIDKITRASDWGFTGCLRPRLTLSCSETSPAATWRAVTAGSAPTAEPWSCAKTVRARPSTGTGSPRPSPATSPAPAEPSTS
ncbi:hypothetical protein [Streptomyces tailanensis]|uniref:hypothetical protein n=1 Tax=Streptomyces tailanensis TaxID=2569858 RepID=UPI00122DFD93|nr:hypothetical protein [Streptomyces tailanensis]